MPIPYVQANLPPAGVYPAVAYEPGITQATPIVPPPVLADNLGADGELLSLFQLIHPVDAAIREAFRLFRDTGAAVLNTGQRFTDIKKNDDAAPRRMEDEANRILAPFVTRGDIEVIKLDVDTELAPDLGALLVRYRNLRTGKEQAVSPSGT